jgi:hypothetical protein
MAVLQVLAMLVVILLMAFMIEAAVEFFIGKAFEKFPKLKPYSWCLMYVAAVAGIAGAMLYQFDMLNLLSRFVDLVPPIPITGFGMVLTGLTIGRGSNAVHDVYKKFFFKPPLEQSLPPTVFDDRVRQVIP